MNKVCINTQNRCKQDQYTDLKSVIGYICTLELPPILMKEYDISHSSETHTDITGVSDIFKNIKRAEY